MNSANSGMRAGATGSPITERTLRSPLQTFKPGPIRPSLGPGCPKREVSLLGMAKKAQAQAEAPKGHKEQLEEFLQGAFVQENKRAEGGRNENLEAMLQGVIIGAQVAEAAIRRKLEGSYRAMQQSIGNEMAELMEPVKALREQMQQERMQSPEALAAKFAAGVPAPAQGRKGVTVKEPEGEVVNLDEIGKIIGPEKPKAS